MNKWRRQFSLLVARALDSAETIASRVMALGKESLSYLRFHLLGSGRNVKSVVAQALTSVAYYSLASVLTVVMLGAVLCGVIAVGLLSFWLHLVDAS